MTIITNYGFETSRMRINSFESIFKLAISPSPSLEVAGHKWYMLKSILWNVEEKKFKEGKKASGIRNWLYIYIYWVDLNFDSTCEDPFPHITIVALFSLA